LPFVTIFNRFIHSKNRAGLTYRLAVNHLTDKTDKELKIMNGFRRTPGHHGGLPDPYQQLKKHHNVKDMPTQFDWRILGTVCFHLLGLTRSAL